MEDREGLSHKPLLLLLLLLLMLLGVHNLINDLVYVY